jgi:DNA helicase HerA-like ATPase
MILDDKKRVIGKIVSIDSDRFTVELLSGIKNFNVSGYDDIHYFAQINSYVIVPYQDRYIVSEVVGVREKDTPDFKSAKEQELNKVYSVKHLDVLPIGTIKNNKFCFGVSVYPTLYSDVLYIKDEELNVLFEVQDAEVVKCVDCDKGKCKDHKGALSGKTRTKSFDVGESAIFPDYKIKIDVDKFFGSHSAVLGNTGSGKSCTISSMLQTIFSKEKEFFAIGSTFVIFDVNGEYKQAFSNLDKKKINVRNLSIEKKVGFEQLTLPHYFLNIEEWTLLLNASEKTQIPILRNALGLATLFGTNNKTNTENVKNHILASCIIETFNSSDSPVSKYQKIQSLIARGTFTANIDDGYNAQYGNFPPDGIKQQSFLDAINGFLLKTHFEIPSFDNTNFNFKEFGDYLDLAILYEESHGNKQIRDYCSSLITRFKSIQERSEFSFLIGQNTVKLDDFLKKIIGLKGNKKEKQVIILDLNSAEDEVVEIVSAVITRLIFNHLKNLGNDKRNKFPINLVLEEAHRYISIDTQRNSFRASYVFERVAKEGRKYGLFLLVSSQRPSELSRTVLSQCNNFIVHRIQNPDDLSHIRQITPHISESTLKKLPSIPTQHALIFGSAVNIPTLYKVKNAHPLPLSDNNRVSDNWFVDKDHKFEI